MRLSTLLTAIAVMGLALAVPPSSEAVTITSVSVTITGSASGAQTWCSTSVVCGSQIWNLGPGGITLTGTQTLVLSQTGPTFNFDTSEPNGVSCNASNTCTTTVVINGVTIVSAVNTVLNQLNLDTGDTEHNEARDWQPPIGSPTGYTLRLGYADNIHTDPCADADANCLPENPWTNATFFRIGGASGAGLPSSTFPNHCATNGSLTCFDAGALLITNTDITIIPEPASLVLLGSGLLGISRRRQVVHHLKSAAKRIGL